MLYFSSKHPSVPDSFLYSLNQDVPSLSTFLPSQNHWDYSLIFFFLIPTFHPHSNQSSCLTLLPCTYFLIQFSSLPLFSTVKFKPKWYFACDETNISQLVPLNLLFIPSNSFSLIARLNVYIANQIILYLGLRQFMDSSYSLNKVQKP